MVVVITDTGTHMNPFKTFTVLALVGFYLQSQAALEPPFAEAAQIVLSEWFAIDSQHHTQTQLKALPDDALGRRATLTFISDDQQLVNGTVAWPSAAQPVTGLALLLHPMGRDQHIWWSKDNPIKGGAITDLLREQGFLVVTLDARRHGQRTVDDIDLKTLLARAHSQERRLYNDMIIGSVRDHRLVLQWAHQQWPEIQQVVAVGYSMGAQMSLLLARFEPAINHVLAMVPPYVDQANSPVAPRHHLPHISAQSVTLFTADQDPYANDDQNDQLFELLNSEQKRRHRFDSGHVLPPEYLPQAMQVLKRMGGVKDEGWAVVRLGRTGQ